MDKVSKNHLQNCNGVWYYRRRVPAENVAAMGRATVFETLGTRDLKEAKRRRDVRDVEWTARFEASAPVPATVGSASPVLTSPEADRAAVVRIVQRYVERMDARMERRFEDKGPVDEKDRRDRIREAEYELQMLRNPDDPRSGAWIMGAERDIRTTETVGLTDEAFANAAAMEVLRRAVVELRKRNLARLTDERGHAFHDVLFGPVQEPKLTFGDLAAQLLREEDEEALSNGVAQKTRDRTKAQVALVRALVGDEVPVGEINPDRCMDLRRMFARVPTNWTKHYKGLALDAAIERGRAEGRGTLGAITQEQNLAAFRRILDLAVKKSTLSSNPAKGIRPLTRDTVALAEKRQAFTPDQITQFFGSTLYRECAAHSGPPYSHPKQGGWRFWLVPFMLFAGLRPNECFQALISDIKRTEGGT